MQSLALALTFALAQTEAPTTTRPAPADAPAIVKTAPDEKAAPVEKAQPAPEQIKLTPQVAWWQRVTLSGFARVGVFYAFPFREDQLVGGNGGFRLADFRLGLDFRPVDKLTVYTSVELAAPLVDASDPLSGRRIVDLRDAYIQYDVCKGFQVRAGQMRPPYYAEMLLSDGAVPFVSRSVLANGISPPDGFGPRNYLAPDRQLGVQFFSRRLGDAIGFKYAVGVFNGNGQNQLFNDNNAVEPVARVEVDFKEWITLGVNAYYNVKAEGVRPNRLYTSQLAYGADLEAHGYGFSGLVAFLGKSSTFNYAGLTPESQLGVLGQVRYFHEKSGLEAAARVAFYEPSSAQVEDQVIEAVGMVGWKPFGLPFRVLLQYTHRQEEGAVNFPNDSVDAMLHAVW